MIWICCVFYPLVLFIFSLSSYLCFDLHKFHFTNSIVFLLVYLAVFISRFTESPVLHNFVLAVLLKKIIFHIRKFRASGFCKIEVLEKRKKKKSVKKKIEKNDKYYKNSVQSWRYNWRNWALILENLLKTNGACVWSETNARIFLRSWFVCI